MNRKNAANHGECLRDECLTDYLEGTLDPVVRSACEVHLVACDACRENLALFMRVLRADTSSEEEAALQELSRALEQRNLPPIPTAKRWALSTKYRIYGATAIAAVLLAAVFIGWLPSGAAPSRQAQIAEALVATLRPFEPRMVGQPYLEIQESTRGPEALVPDVLAAEMTESSAQFYEVGRYFLLLKEYAKAIKLLKTAIADSQGVPADVYNDLGVAYLQSGPENFAAAESEFKNALNRNPAHLPAVFNLSILYGRQGRLEDARRHGQGYLDMDPDSGWAKEIQRKFLRKESTEP